MEERPPPTNVYIIMTSKELKTSILNHILTILGFDKKIINPDGSSITGWSEMDNEDIHDFVDGVFDTLNGIKSNPDILNSLPHETLNNIDNNLINLINTYESIKSIPGNEMTTQHHGVLNMVNNLGSVLRSTGIYTQLKLTNKNLDEVVAKLKEANKNLKQFDANQFERAISLVEELTKKKIIFEEKTIQESLGTFIRRASEHKIYTKRILKIFPGGQWYWMLLALIMGGIIIYFVSSFIEALKDNNNISIGTAILRVSSLAVPTYFMIFCMNQFKYHKTMYEIYSFKNTALNMMTELMKTNETRSDYILEKGLKVLFTEPSLKDDGKNDKQIISELMTILNNQINKN